ncbi:MAG TPA: hypothetical protein VF581_04905 [Flavobacterium sp.]|jgi:hypothetical protein
MKKFLIKCLLIFCIVTAGFTYALYSHGGTIDYFYNKFTTPTQKSLITGDSRSLQGIQPSVLNKCLAGSNYELPFFNFSFTIKEAAYGPLYTESILKKLDPETKNGVFILTVDPWLFAKRPDENYQEKEYFEKGKPPHNMTFYSANPNYEYLIRNYGYFHFRSIFSKPSELHKDGWLEERKLPEDSAAFNRLLDLQHQRYTEFAAAWKKDEFRMKELRKLVERLQKHGKVFLVRLPTIKSIEDIEDKFWPGFDAEIQQVAYAQKVSYLNFVAVKGYQTYDGNHLDKKGGAEFTKTLCDSIIAKDRAIN